MAAVYGCMAAVYGCTCAVYGCMAAVSGRFAVVYGCTRAVYGSVAVMYGMAAAIYGCVSAVYGCDGGWQGGEEREGGREGEEARGREGGARECWRGVSMRRSARCVLPHRMLLPDVRYCHTVCCTAIAYDATICPVLA
eukprot:3905261-Rhodomonas_salina.2